MAYENMILSIDKVWEIVPNGAMGNAPHASACLYPYN